MVDRAVQKKKSVTLRATSKTCRPQGTPFLAVARNTDENDASRSCDDTLTGLSDAATGTYIRSQRITKWYDILSDLRRIYSQ
jgi:hypothetical protein